MIYLDNAATTFPKPQAVVGAVRATMEKVCANPGRSGHDMALSSLRVVNAAREKLQKLIGANSSDDIAFTLNCTDALNMGIKGVVRPGWHIITTMLEHNSVLRVLKQMERVRMITLSIIEPERGGIVDPRRIERAVNRSTRMIVLTHASNVLGTAQPIGEAAQIARRYRLIFMVDAAQSAGVLPIDVVSGGIDLLAMAGHKGLYGPQGTGALYVAPHIDLSPYRQGGTGTMSESLYQPDDMPEKLESGTLNTPGLAGLFTGVNYVLKNFDSIRTNEKELTQRLLGGLEAIPGVAVYGTRDIEKKVGVVSFNIGDMQSGLVADMLNSAGIAVRAGLHCAPGAHSHMGTLHRGAVRVSVGAFNTAGDIDKLLEQLGEIASSG